MGGSKGKSQGEKREKCRIERWREIDRKADRDRQSEREEEIASISHSPPTDQYHHRKNYYQLHPHSH